MTSAQFKSDDSLVKAWKELQDNEILKIVMEIASSESPMSEKPGNSDTEAMVHYGKILGYAMYQSKLQDLASYNEVKPHPQRTYARKRTE